MIWKQNYKMIQKSTLVIPDNKHIPLKLTLYEALP